MLDRARLIHNGGIGYGYIKDWCESKGGCLTGGVDGEIHRISFPGAAGNTPFKFWLPRLGDLDRSQPLEAAWEGDAFTGPEAYLPGMLSVLLNSVAGAGRGVEIILSQGNHLPEGLDPLAVYYFLLPTDFQLALAHKGEFEAVITLPGALGGRFGFQGSYEEENRFIRTLEEALAPAHPIYPVGPEAPELIRPFFLLGHRQAVLKSLARENDMLVLVFRLNSLPGDGPAEVAGHFKAALAGAVRPDAGLTVRRVHAGGRSAVTRQELEPLFRAYITVSGLQPDIDWFMWPSPAGALCEKGYKTAAFGPGRYPEYLAGSSFGRPAGEKLGLILQALLAAE